MIINANEKGLSDFTTAQTTAPLEDLLSKYTLLLTQISKGTQLPWATEQQPSNLKEIFNIFSLAVNNFTSLKNNTLTEIKNIIETLSKQITTLNLTISGNYVNNLYAKIPDYENIITKLNTLSQTLKNNILLEYTLQLDGTGSYTLIAKTPSINDLFNGFNETTDILNPLQTSTQIPTSTQTQTQTQKQPAWVKPAAIGTAIITGLFLINQ